MTTTTFATFSDADVAQARAAHPAAFDNRLATILRGASWAIVIGYLIYSFYFFNFALLFGASDRALLLLNRIFSWRDMANWNYESIYIGIAQTVAMAFLGTLLGTIAALGIAFFAAKNTMPVFVVRHGVRRVLDIFRGIDSVVWGLVFVRAVGLGPLAGVLAIFISDMGNLAKLYSEAIENIDRKQVEGVRATGADSSRIIRYGYVPQIMPVFISLSLYSFESSTRSATILGLVGAGGVGMVIIERFRAGLFDQVAFVVLNILVVIAIIDWGRRTRSLKPPAGCRRGLRGGTVCCLFARDVRLWRYRRLVALAAENRGWLKIWRSSGLRGRSGSAFRERMMPRAARPRFQQTRRRSVRYRPAARCAPASQGWPAPGLRQRACRNQAACTGGLRR